MRFIQIGKTRINLDRVNEIDIGRDERILIYYGMTDEAGDEVNYRSYSQEDPSYEALHLWLSDGMPMPIGNQPGTVFSVNDWYAEQNTPD